MNHIELIKSELEEAVKRDPGIFGTAPHVVPSEEIQNFIDYIKAFEKAGYKITVKKDVVVKNKGCTHEKKENVLRINMKKDGISANSTLELESDWIYRSLYRSFTFRAITPNGAYVQIYPEKDIQGGRLTSDIKAEEIIAELEKQPKSKEEAQERLKQNMSEYIHDFEVEPLSKNNTDGRVSVRRNIQIESLVLDGIVTIAEDGKISEAIYAPDAEVWFEFSCCAPTGATFNILSNGEKFIPITRYGTQKLSTDMSPKGSVNLKHMSKHDQELTQIAIKVYLESL